MDSNVNSHSLQALKPKRLGNRLAWYFISIGFVFTLVVSVAIIEFEHLQRSEQIDEKSRETVSAIENQLIRSLWNVDDESTQILLEGITRSPSISGVQLVDENGVTVSVGNFQPPEDFSHPLVHDEQKLGKLLVKTNSSYLDQHFLDQIKVLGLSAAVFMGLFGCFLQIIVRRLVTEHISVISKATSDPERLDANVYKPIILKRPPIDDELTDLVNALNQAQKQAIDFKRTQESYENQLEYQANNDALTHLPNRRHIDRHLSKQIQEISRLSGHEERLAVFFIDLDGFKEVNDSMGHSVGDTVLQASGKRLKSLLLQNKNGYLARFGGDEFIAACSCTSKRQAETIGEQIINSFRESFEHREVQLQLGCSLGIVFFPDDGTTPEELIRKADTAMYHAKNSGRNTFTFFEQSMMQDVMLKNTIKNKLQDALIEERLKIHYQPLINLRDMSINGFEALLRWEDKDLGKVRPDLFIPIAEQTGLIFRLDKWVLKTAAKQVKQWRDKFDRPFSVSVNFSPTNFHHRQLMSWVKEDLISVEELEFVEIEVTERLVLNYDRTVLAGIEEMMRLGISFSIDDFGTGYSSLGYIKKFSHILSKIKIDRLFVQELINSSSDRALVQSIVTLADSLNIEVLAEGIESRRQEEALIQLGCDYAQGFFYSKPLSVEDMPAFIDSWQKTPRVIRKY